MTIRKARNDEAGRVAALVEDEPLLASDETYSEEYFARLIKQGIVLVDEEKPGIVGLCFGTYNKQEGWADLLGVLVLEEYRRQGRASALVAAFEEALPESITTVDRYTRTELQGYPESQGYEAMRTYTHYQKRL